MFFEIQEPIFIFLFFLIRDGDVNLSDRERGKRGGGDGMDLFTLQFSVCFNLEWKKCENIDRSPTLLELDCIRKSKSMIMI